VESKIPDNGRNLAEFKRREQSEGLVAQANIVRALSSKEEVSEGHLDIGPLVCMI